MTEATNQRTASTAKSAAAMIAIAVLIVVAGVALYYALTVPGVLESVTNILMIAAVVIGAAVGIIVLFAAVLAVPMYAAKGETYQEGVDYSLDDVEPVEDKRDGGAGPKV